jgi:hypothetical protein
MKTGVALVAIVFASTPALAQVGSGAGPAERQPLFAHDSIIAFVLETDLAALRRDRGDDAEERPARIILAVGPGEFDTLALQVKTRGKSRLRRDVCNFPPLRLNFPRRETDGTLFENQDRLKLVTHCQDRRDVYEQYVLQEYLLYRVYHRLTPASFRVRLARITYRNATSEDEGLTRYGFLIEDEDRLAARLGRWALPDSVEVHQDELDFDNAVLFPLFQFLIANLDWSVSGQRNIKVLGGDGMLPIAVPYDFDLSGVINTRYAAIPTGVKISDMRERLFVSPCKNLHDLAPAFARFREERDGIFALYESFAALDRDPRESTLRFFREFYEILDDDRAVQRQLVRGCP